MITRNERVILHNELDIFVEMKDAGILRPYTIIEAALQLVIDNLKGYERSKTEYQVLFMWNNEQVEDFFGPVFWPPVNNLEKFISKMVYE